MNSIALVFVLTLMVAAMTAAATAVRSVSRIWLRHWAERQIAGETDQAAPALGRPHQYLLAAGTGIAAVVFAMGAMLAFREDSARLVQFVVIAALSLLVGGQVIPRAIARRWATTCVPALMPMLKLLNVLFGPILGFGARLVRPLIVRGAASPAPDPTDPLEDLLREAEMEGIGEAAESEIISGVVEFGEKRVRDAMTPRARVTLVAASLPPDDLAQAVAQSGYTRVPVFGDDGRELLGVLHALDVLDHPRDPLGSLRPATVATPDEPCGVVMRRMLRDHRHLAVVRDAGGELVGIITLEDLVEELVGEIGDEHDEPGGTA